MLVPAQDVDAKALNRINAYRKGAGLEPVVHDPASSKICLAHAKYLSRNIGDPFSSKVNLLAEDSKLPGYTSEGQMIASSALVGFDRLECADLIDSGMNSFHFRLRLLDPNLKRIGFARVKEKGGRWFSVVDVTSGVGLGQVQFYPVDKQKDVPLTFPGNEVPDPIPDAKQKIAGFPITVLFPWSMPPKSVTVRLADDKGSEVDAWISTPEKPLGTGALGNMVYIIAKEPLKPDTRYTVDIAAEIHGKPWQQTTSFTTRPGERAEADLGARILEKINAYRKRAGLPGVSINAGLAKGSLAHATYLSKNNDYLIAKEQSQTLEDPMLPGFTEEGSKAGKNALIGFELNEPSLVVDHWMGLFYSRYAILDPLLRSVGIAAIKDPSDGWIVVLARDRANELSKIQVITYPAENQKDVPLAYSLALQESPDPIPESKDKQAGFPLTVLFPENQQVKEATALLLDDKAKEVPGWLSTPEKPFTPGTRANNLCLIAKQPLQPKTTYTVTFQARVNNRPWKRTWSFTTEDIPVVNKAEVEAKVLDKINAYRKTLGLNPVKGFDAVLSKGCQAHAEYLVKNSNDPSTAGLGMHNEDAKLPGYSKEGERAGKNSVIASMEPLEAVDSWMATPFHRRPFLNPDLKQIGLGTALGGKLGRITVLDAGTDVGTDKPIVYPYDKEREVPLAYQPGERPSPIPEGEDKPAGYPITVSFPASNIVKNVTAQLRDTSGKESPVWLSTAEKPTTPQLQRNTVCVIAKAPLRASSLYTITLKADVNGEPWQKKWTFATARK
jgi:uncharacterized protein YkwD